MMPRGFYLRNRRSDHPDDAEADDVTDFHDDDLDVEEEPEPILDE